jgi:hypothetical protein
MTVWHRARRVMAAALLCAAWGVASASAQGVTVALSPALQVVSAGQEFDVTLEVSRAGSAFNGFDAIVGYDPAALTFVQLSPVSLQEGDLMTTACGNRFHRFRPGSDRDTITDVLLCDGVSVTGPGTIYRLHFRAGTTNQVTHVTFLPGLRFYNAGLYVTPLQSSDATVSIGMATGVGSGPQLAPGAAPNPFRTATVIRLGTTRTGPVSIVDTQGRSVRRLEASAGRATWDGRNEAGVRLPPGTYWARSGATRPMRLTLLQ